MLMLFTPTDIAGGGYGSTYYAALPVSHPPFLQDYRRIVLPLLEDKEFVKRFVDTFPDGTTSARL